MLTFEQIQEWVVRCLRCGTCKYLQGSYLPSCPAGEKFRFEPYFASGKNSIARGLLSGELKFSDPGLVEILYSCPVCGNCQVQCPFPHAEHLVDIYEALRARAVEEGFGPLPEHQPLVNSLRQYDNPWLQPRSRKARWSREMDLKNPAREKVRVLYFVGCTAALDPDLRNIPLATASLLRAAGVDFGVLGPDEICCGSTALRIGERKIFSELAGRNAKLINSLGVETVITSCAGCFRTLKHDYSNVARLEPEILHSSEFLDRLFRAGKLSFRKKFPEIITYHDPCHLGRLGGVFDPPRELINRIPGAEFRELESNREHAFCCGAGGGVRTAFPDWATENVGIRIAAAEKTGAGILVSTCPFCYQNFIAGIEKCGSRIRFADLVEVLARLAKK